METARPRVLVYDGDCSLCRRFSRIADRRWLVGAAERRPYDAFEGEIATRLEAAGIRNELAVLDETTGELRSGYDGMVWLLRGGRLPWLASVLAFGPVRWFLGHDYRLIAYNRRLLAPPARRIACACDPDLHRGYRVAFLAVALLWTAGIAALAGLLFWTPWPFIAKAPTPTGVTTGTAWWGALVPVGWFLTVPIGVRLPAPRGWDHAGHLAWILAAMVLPLLLAIVVALGGAVLAGLLGGLVPDEWLLADGVPLGFGATAWALALPIAVGCALWRLPRVGLSRLIAVVVGLVLWAAPTALLLVLLPLGAGG